MRDNVVLAEEVRAYLRDVTGKDPHAVRLLGDLMTAFELRTLAVRNVVETRDEWHRKYDEAMALLLAIDERAAEAEIARLEGAAEDGQARWAETGTTRK